MAYKRSRKAFEDDIQKSTSPFVIYGTPLPPIDDDARDDGSFVPVWKQEVTDDRGRKRLHGAFTGGFSAGYFNTVGSKEGWTPSTFVSSRTNRAKDQKTKTRLRPEDFMDDEDIREQEESKILATAEGYSGFGTENDPMHKNLLMGLFKPPEDSMGVKLLHRMGWKQGQGIGPRIRRKIESEKDSGDTHMFAPDDVPMISFTKKTDSKGLGYEVEATSAVISSGLTANPTQSAQESDGEDLNRPGLSFMGHRKTTSKAARGGFGVGILNDTGSDEEDPYSMGPKISYNKIIGFDKKAKKKSTSTFGTANPLLKSKPTFIPKKLASLQHTLRKCHDGRLPLTGFVLADELDDFSKISLSDDKYKPPEVPPDWRSAKLPNVSMDDSTQEKQSATFQSTADAAKQSTHTSTTRAALLGEQRLPGKSIFDFVTPEARENLMKASGKTHLPPALSERLPDGSHDPHTPDPISVPHLDVPTAKLALSRGETGGFIPYAEDVDKRARYEHFLELSAGHLPEGTLPLKPPNLIEDWQTELHEFVRAAEVFRPMTGAIASRFTSGTSTNSSTNHNSNPDLLREYQAKPEDPAEVAAKLGMFGILTRSISSFQPTRLLCKRFNVDMPVYMPETQSFKPTSTTNTTSQTSSTMSQSNTLHPETTVKSTGFITGGKDQHTIANPLETTVDGVNSAQTSINTGAYLVDPDKNEALEQERPGQDVFKAIFGDADSDDD